MTPEPDELGEMNISEASWSEVEDDEMSTPTSQQTWMMDVDGGVEDHTTNPLGSERQ